MQNKVQELPLLGVRCGSRENTTIALTFDDGPSYATEPVLKILQKYQIRATFFLIGKYVAELPDVARLLVSYGHEIGNHTYSHPNDILLKNLLNPFPEDEVAKTQTIIKKTLGITPKVFRPTKALALHPGLKKVLMKYDLLPVTASAFLRAAWDEERQYKNITRNLHGGDIVLLHDGYDKDHTSSLWGRKTLAILPRIIEHAGNKGLKFATVSELLES